MSKYAVGDIQGNYKVWEKIKTILKPDDTLYVLGSAMDYGEDGVKIIQEIMNDSRIVYLFGTHDYFFCNRYKYNTSHLHNNNGGSITWQKFSKLTEAAQKKIYNFLKTRPLFTILINNNSQEIYLSNNGCENFKLTEGDFLFHNNYAYDTEPSKFDFSIHGNITVKEIEGWKRTQNKKSKSGDVVNHWYNKNHLTINNSPALTNSAILVNLDTLEERYVTA